MKVSDNFTVEEYVNPQILAVLGETRAANIINPYLIKTVQRLRNRNGKIIINGVFGGKTFTNSGVRYFTFYKNRFGIQRNSFSTHLFCNTADLKFAETSPIIVYKFILKNQDLFPNIVRMENAEKTRTWLHIECGRYRDGDIEVFDP